MNKKVKQEAENFLNNEKQFHLGILPTEQSNPKSRNIDLKFADNPADGVKMLLSVDRDIHAMAKKVLKGNEFMEMVNAGEDAVSKGNKIVFSGCGSTGRLSILLEAMWRYFYKDLKQKYPEIYNQSKQFEDCVYSIMTGGEYALIRSVEYFEDYHVFGRQQVSDLDMTEEDVLIAITEGGETSSVLGTVAEAADRGAKVFLLFNNPASVLIDHIDRSRRAIEDPRVTVLDLFCGPMAIAGSTRMQAMTSEQLIAGAALETILGRILDQILSRDQKEMLNIRKIDYASAFNTLLDDLVTDLNTKILAEYLNMEKGVYQENGLITYFAENFLLDIFTDTTERAPTFMLPPFKKIDDTVSPVSWAFVKNPLRSTAAAWEYVLGRSPRCLEWDSDLYREMGVPGKLAYNPPVIDTTQIMKFYIGNDEDNSRLSRSPNVAVSIVGSREMKNPAYENYRNAFKKCASKFEQNYTLVIGEDIGDADYRILCSPVRSVFNLMEHLAIKLILNTVSTGTMILMGRVTSNWMSWVDVSNKKLKDRGIRLISEICNLSYRDACYALHETIEQLEKTKLDDKEKPSPVQYTIDRLKSEDKNK